MDEGSLSFNCPSIQNSSFEREKTALIRTTENLKIYIINVHSNMYKKSGKVEIPTFFKGKKMAKEDLPPEVLVCIHENEWMCENIMLDFGKNFW